MRSLSPTLLAAQKSATGQPYVRVEVLDQVAGIARLNWSRLYAGSEPDGHHAAAVAGDGALLRARLDPATYQLYYQRVANPGPGSNFSSWSLMASASSQGATALAAQGAGVLLFYVGADQTTIYCLESSDCGASFTPAQAVLTAAGPVNYLAAAFNASGVAALFYTVGSNVYVVKRSAGVWGAPSPWDKAMGGLSGLASCWSGDWDLAVTGHDASGYRGVWTCVYGDATNPGSWSALEPLAAAASGSAMEFTAPSLARPDVFRAFFVEVYTGPGAYTRCHWSHAVPGAAFGANLWREPVPFDPGFANGLALTYTGSHAWLSHPSGVWRAALTPACVDVSADVVEASFDMGPGRGSCRILLRNDDGQYQGLGSGALAAIREGSEVRLSPGYRTGQGNEWSAGPCFWVSGWEYLSRAGRSYVALHGEDWWGLLAAWRARRQFAWNSGSKNVSQLLAFLLARAGLVLEVRSSSSALAGLTPAFTLHPGETGREAVARLLAMVPDVLFFDLASGVVVYPQAGDATAYSYGTDHAVWEGRYAISTPVDWVQVYGAGVLGEALSWGDIAGVYDRLRQVHDLNLATAAQAQDRAQAELRRAELGRRSGEIVVPPNCGQELYDVVAVTDARAGLSASRRRVLGLALHYSAREGRYRQEIGLGGV